MQSSHMLTCLVLSRAQWAPIPPIIACCFATDYLRRYLCIHFPHKMSRRVLELVKHGRTVEVLQACIGSANVKCMQVAWADRVLWGWTEQHGAGRNKLDSQTGLATGHFYDSVLSCVLSVCHRAALDHDVHEGTWQTRPSPTPRRILHPHA